MLKISQVTADDGGKYEVVIQNHYGTEVHCISLAVEGTSFIFKLKYHTEHSKILPAL